MDPDPGKFIEFLDGRIGRKATTILAWLLFVVILVWALRFLVTELVIPLEKIAGGTGDLRRDFLSESFGPFWASVIITAAILAASLVLFVPLMNLIIGGRRVPMSVLSSLEKLRSQAIHDVLNFVPTTDAEYEDWKGRDQKFVDDAVDVLKREFSSVEVLRFKRLGVIPGVQFGFAYNAEHQHGLMMLAKRLDTLEKIVDRYMGP